VKWTLDDSRLVYGVGQKDLHFLDINREGELCIALGRHRTTLAQVIQQVVAKTPQKGSTRSSSFTLRVPQLVSSQMTKVLTAFGEAIKEERYQGGFRAVYPLKVNATRQVVRQVLTSSSMYGLEVGTKAELALALDGLLDDRQRLLVCNGVKDEEYLDIVRKAILNGYRIWVSIESPNEAKMSLERLPREKLELALRVKPYVVVQGHWSSAAGRNAKFGLAVHDLIEVLELLKANHAESSVVAIHAHPGSQLSGDISAFAEFVARVYLYLRDTGFSRLTTVDVGGRIPINYDGHLESDTTRSYAHSVVKAIAHVVGNAHPHPIIMSEAGRVVTALHALLVIRILETRRLFPTPLRGEAEASDLVKQVGLEVERAADQRTILQAWQHWLNLTPGHKEVDDLLRYERLSGVLKVRLRHKLVHSVDYENRLNNSLAQDLMRPEYILVGDFAVFNGAIDHVLVDQYFPVLPIDHLHESPATLVRLVDITGDSDGEISVYSPPISGRRLFTQDEFPLTTNRRQQWSGFPIGSLDTIAGSYVVIALVGAYQDAIRMDANLVGALPNVELHVSDQGRWTIR